MRITTPLAALLLLFPGLCLSDGNFRCGNSLVSADDSVAVLLKKCGEPSSREVSTADVHNDHGVKIGTSTTEVWHYAPGSGAATPMVVTIVDGQVQSIERGK